MAKITRIFQNIFASTAGAGQIGEFGSLAAGTPVTTTSAAVAQSLNNWKGGWFDAILGGNSPAIEDMNAVHFVTTYQLAYLMQAGIAEWQTDTVYYQYSLVNYLGNVFMSKVDTNTGNTPGADATKWTMLVAQNMAVKYNTAAGQSITSGAAPILNFGSREYDPLGLVTIGSNWCLTVPTGGDGKWRMSVAATFASSAWAANPIATLQAYQNLTTPVDFLAYFKSVASFTDRVMMVGTSTFNLVAGNKLSVLINQNTGGSKSLETDATFNYISIERISN